MINYKIVIYLGQLIFIIPAILFAFHIVDSIYMILGFIMGLIIMILGLRAKKKLLVKYIL
ncbi:hypothetical protein [Listeria ivanovii]|uniref:Uncharacterized protein n=2 Tax=Listeria ivanovii TaxID=1638 RepID=A0ABS1G0V5_LISIV|nr:hypothetical protein [Listeria ivanovii]EFR97224.1 hypothetical protein NT05LI_1463 [Listeria ivanovii FSL F6-596]AIS59614.1 hypothetical protein JL58_06250 [Listeria ivanovii subsp. londoniensis]AIS62446.1 hypothetical protein JL53_06780 [Listeria ivanovii subsp. londoniensis]MBK1960512.1 hypothetical protein [Listeria ivanovii subsp. londoniensis]MBK1965159.1 hypothetical protein [Listeria ivanovii subsp. londoniensis]